MTKKTNNEVVEMKENMTTEVITTDTAPVQLLDGLMNPNANFYCSIQNDGSRKSKVKIYNAINNADKKIADCIGETLELVDVVAHPAQVVDEETGEVVEILRTVLIDKDGVSYSASSVGITNSLEKIFAIVGMPSWADEPLKVKIKQIATGNGNNKVNTLVLVE